MPTRASTHRRSEGLIRNRAATHARQDEALRLRERNMSFIEIARLLGYAPHGVPNAQSAHMAVRRAQERRDLAYNEALRQAAEHLRRERYQGPDTDVWVGESTPRRRTVAIEDLVPSVDWMHDAVNTSSNTPTTQVTNASAEAPAPVPARSRRGRPFVSERTFGVEAEFFGLSMERAARALREAGIDVHTTGYGHTVTSYWRITTDSSVHREGLELVSPVMRGVEGLAEVKLALDTLRAAGGRVDDSCGLHVHVGMDNLNGAQLMKIIELYAANQTTIDGLVANNRRDNYYSRHIPQANMTRLRSSLANANTTQAIVHAVNGLARYYTVNVDAYIRYGTLEFRQHQGTLHGKKATTWVQFILGLVEKAITMDDATIRFASVHELVEELGCATPIKRALERRHESSTRSSA